MQWSAARAAGRQRHPAEMAPLHVRDAVVRRHPLVQERVVRRQQIQRRPVLPHDAVEEALGLADHPAAQRLVERERVRIAGPHRRVGQVAKLQPLPGEVAGQRVRTRVGQHPPHLPFQLGRIAQAARLGRPQELVVGDAAPDEKEGRDASSRSLMR